MFAQIMPLHKEHDNCIQLLMSIHKSKQVSGISLRENLESKRKKKATSLVMLSFSATRLQTLAGTDAPLVRISLQVVEDPEAVLVKPARTTKAYMGYRLRCH